MVKSYHHAIAIQRRRVRKHKPGIAKAVRRWATRQPINCFETLKELIDILPVL